MIGVVLAGGRSSRMGRDKAQLEVPGRPGFTLLNQAIEVLRRAGAAEVWVSGRIQGAVLGEPRIDADRFIVDAAPFEGPMGGVSSVLASCRPGVSAEVLVFLAVDMPDVTPEACRNLARALELNPGTVASCFDGDPLPFAIRCGEGAADTLRGGGGSVRDWLEQLGALKVERREARFHNVNTPVEWAVWSRREVAIP